MDWTSTFSSTSVSNLASALSAQQSQRESLAYSALNRGAARIQENKYDMALNEFRRAAAYMPNLVEAQLYIGRTYALLDRTDDAIKAYQKAVQLDPTFLDARKELANYYLTNERYAEAEQQLLQIARTNPASTGPISSLGYIYLNTGRLAEAETQFAKAISLSPSDPSGYYSLGLVYNKQGGYAEAVAQFKKAIQLNPTYAVAYADLASSYLGMDESELAQEQVDTLISMNTDESNSLAYEIETTMFKPKILYDDIILGTFDARLGPGTTLDQLDPSLATPGAVKTFTMIFQFNKQMDVASVQNIYNWDISQATGGVAGAYNNGVNLHLENEIMISPIPTSVRYDPVTHRAIVSFKIRQNEAGTGVMDPSHWVFRFSGTDAEGNAMDPHGDEYDRYALGSF